ncbi:beta-lactamase domain protein [Methanobacterium lacus]|uniref:Beta-lactamase domain protein n=1 Tax=Methanobacterium lacus (strain AL-21) TaxID=877455 RepID=F0T824_METLA|nr:MBL fold metallo-hydrolase [Methanobacterium lacus]ADZ09650.1 beta-lactamase domain protein [Methanobacterium lacus]
MKIGENVYALESTKGSYSYLIMDKEPILIDTGYPGKFEDILEEINSLNLELKSIKHILLTHHDVDHVGNAALLQEETGATLWASKDDIPYILGDKCRPGIKKLVSFILRPKKPEKIQVYQNTTIGDVQIISTPGHTPGHVSFLYEDILFAGDLVGNTNGKLKKPPIFGNSNTKSIDESIIKMNEYDFNWICPAHGEPIELKDEWKQLLNNIRRN